MERTVRGPRTLRAKVEVDHLRFTTRWAPCRLIPSPAASVVSSRTRSKGFGDQGVGAVAVDGDDLGPVWRPADLISVYLMIRSAKSRQLRQRAFRHLSGAPPESRESSHAPAHFA